MSGPLPSNLPKFGFDNEFFDVTVSGGGNPKLDDRLNAAKEEGFAAGLTEGRTQAAAAAALEVAELKNQLLLLTQKLTAAQTEWQAMLTRQSLSLLRLTLHHLVGHAASHYPDQLLEHYLKDLLPMLRTSDELTLRLHPQSRNYHEKLGLPQASIGGHPMHIVPDSSLGPADCLVEWRSGGLEVRLPDILSRLDALLQGAGAEALPVPPPPATATPAIPAPPAPDPLGSPVAVPDPVTTAADASADRANALLGEDNELVEQLKPATPDPAK